MAVGGLPQRPVMLAAHEEHAAPGGSRAPDAIHGLATLLNAAGAVRLLGASAARPATGSRGVGRYSQAS
jgi:hypothetical protein